MRRAAWLGLILLSAGCETTSGTGLRNESLLTKADDLYLQEKYSQAVGHYDMFLTDNPGHERRAELRVRIGKCYLASGRPERALDAFDRALASQPPPGVRADALFRKGIALRMLGDVPRSLDAFRGLPRADLDRAGITADEFAYEYAQTLFRTGDWKGGQAELAKISRQGPLGAKARTRLGLESYAVQIGAYADESQARAAAARAPGAVYRGAPGLPPLYLVSQGAFPRWEDAQREAERLKASGLGDAFVIP